MARSTLNLHRVQTLPQFTDITAVVVTHIPNLEGYHKDRLKVLKLSLTSLSQHADLPIDLMVFDNGSCSEVTNYLNSLKEEGIIQILILSGKNIGLAGAYQIISHAAPGKFIAFANDDVFYFPNWLSPQINILRNIPEVGLVSGFYLRGINPDMVKLAHEKRLHLKQKPAPDEWMAEFCRDASYINEEAYLEAQKYQKWTYYKDEILSHNNCNAYLGGVCWQAVFHKETLLKTLPNEQPQAHGFKSYDSFFHHSILQLGYLRLSTTERYVRHIGNVITPEMSDLAQSFNIKAQPTVQKDHFQLHGKALDIIDNEKSLRDYLRNKWASLSTKFERIALFGAGAHTIYLLNCLNEKMRKKISVILDEKSSSSEIHNIPVVKILGKNYNCDVVILSSDCPRIQKKMRQSKKLSSLKAPVLNLYEGIAEGPYPKN